MNKIIAISLAAAGILVLSVAGFLPRPLILLLIVFLALLALSTGLSRLFPVRAKIINHFLIFLVAVGVIFNGYENLIKPHLVMTRPAADRSIIGLDVIIARILNPENLASQIEISKHLEELEDKISAPELKGKLANIRQRATAGKITAQQAREETVKVIKEAGLYPPRGTFGCSRSTEIIEPEKPPVKEARPRPPKKKIHKPPKNENLYAKQQPKPEPPAPPPPSPPSAAPPAFQPPVNQPSSPIKSWQEQAPPRTPEMQMSQEALAIYNSFWLTRRQSIDEVANDFNQPQQFKEQLLLGWHKAAQTATCPSGTVFRWVINNDDYPSQTWPPVGQNGIAGREYNANIGGQRIKFFYPSSGFFVGVKQG